MKYLHYSLYAFCKSSKKEMNLSSTRNCRYIYLLPFHMPTHHFIHYSYIYSKKLLTMILKKIQYTGLLSTTFLKWKSLKLSLLCTSAWQLHHIIPEDLNHSSLYKPILGSNFHHIPVLNKPKSLSIHDE